MTIPPDSSAYADSPLDLDETGEMLEQYVIMTAGDRAGVGAGEADARLRAFIEARTKLIQVTEALRTSWRGDFAERAEEHAFQGQPPRWKVGKGQIPRRVLWPTFLGAVASALVVGMAWWGSVRQRSETAASGATTYVTRNGERAEIRLPDGSTVALNVASRLQVPGDYAAGNHRVTLTGEGVFTVRHHGGTPFTVVAGPVATRVLGTTFLVRRYATDPTVTVAVREGKVAVRSAVVMAHQQIEVGPRGLGRVLPVDPSQFAFETGVLTFHMTPLRDAVAQLDRWYDVDIRIADSAVANNRLDGSFAAGSVADLTTLLQMTFDVQVMRTGRVLTLSPRGQ